MKNTESFGKALYARNKPLLDAKEKAYVAQGLVKVPEAERAKPAGEQAVIDAMLAKQQRLNAAHDAAMKEIRETLGMPPRTDNS